MTPPRSPSEVDRFESWPTSHVVEGRRHELPDPVVIEEPLAIHLDSQPLTVTMRTPGHDLELAAGLLYGEALIEGPADLGELRHSTQSGVENQVEVRLRDPAPLARWRAARAFPASSACGVCGKTTIESIFAAGLPLLEAGRPRLSAAWLEALPERMRAAQALFAKTGGLHAAALFEVSNAGAELTLLREDVGRHNAVDKVIGASLLAGRLPLRDALLLLSGRAGFEIVQKAARAGVPIIAAVGAPSSLALRTAERVGTTLIGFLRRGRFNLYTAPERIALP